MEEALKVLSIEKIIIKNTYTNIILNNFFFLISGDIMEAVKRKE